MDDMDPDGSNDQQPPSHHYIHTLTAMRPSDAGAHIPGFAQRFN